MLLLLLKLLLLLLLIQRCRRLGHLSIGVLLCGEQIVEENGVRRDLVVESRGGERGGRGVAAAVGGGGDGRCTGARASGVGVAVGVAGGDEGRGDGWK